MHRRALRLVYVPILMAATWHCKTPAESTTYAIDAAVPGPETVSSQTICLAAQAAIGGFDVVDLLPFTDVKVAPDLGSFLKSKPVVDSGVHLQSFVPNPVQGLSEYPEIWCTLKNAGDLRAAAAVKTVAAKRDSQNCNAVQQVLFQTELAQDQELQKQASTSGYTFNYMNAPYQTAADWAASKAQIRLEGNGQITVLTTSLESPSGAPVVGGLNSCKLFDPGGLKRVLSDIAASNFDFMALGSGPFSQTELAGTDLATVDTDYNGVLGDLAPQTATLFYQPDWTYKGTYVVSPGGGVPALNMRALAKAVARQGYVVFVVHYPLDPAVAQKIGLENNAAINLAALLKTKNLRALSGLPPGLVTFYSNQTLPIYAFAHGLGAAILGDAIFAGLSAPFDTIIVNGALQFSTSAPQTNITARGFFDILGLEDKLSIRSPDSIKNFMNATRLVQNIGPNLYQQSGTQHFFLEIPHLSHFCVLGDFNIDPIAIANISQDGLAQKPSDCLPLLLAGIASLGYL